MGSLVDTGGLAPEDSRLVECVLQSTLDDFVAGRSVVCIQLPQGRGAPSVRDMLVLRARHAGWDARPTDIGVVIRHPGAV